MLERITIDSQICHGEPCIRGLRIPVYLVVELVASGMSWEEILEAYPDLERDDIRAALLYASALAKEKVIPLGVSGK